MSRYPSLFVIARNSSFTYKGRAVDVKQIGRELGVRYVLEGSLRKSGSRVRVTAQLVEAETGKHVWAERYDRDLADIFAVQDEITEAVTMAIAPSGIGACFVRAFVENGAKVAFLDLQRETGAALADLLGECAARPLFVPCDLTDTAALRAAFGEICAALGPAAVLVNNAANDQRYEFGQITPEQFDRTIAVNAERQTG